ncbi:MAG: hypothetical protein ALAOOOJD_01825 [bacterium]|nr:hypothetical protein [bacterium]
MNFFLPKQPVFFDLFKKLATSVVKIAQLFGELVENFADFEDYSRRAKEIEHQADATTHEIIHRLHSTFVTPLDREDIYLLAHEIDDIVDVIESVIQNIELYEIRTKQEVYSDFAKIIVSATSNLTTLIDHLEAQKDSISMNEEVIKIHGLEDQGDLLFQKSIRDLFKNEKDPIMVVKQKDILFGLEKTMDSYQRVADIIRGIIVKSS